MYSLVALGYVLIYKSSANFNFAQGAMVFFAVLLLLSASPLTVVVHAQPLKVSPEEARQIILKLARDRNAKKVTKGKSMITEEINLNDFLSEHAIEPVETDLGEYILQLAKEHPSHIVAPVVHKSREEVSDLFALKHGRARHIAGGLHGRG